MVDSSDSSKMSDSQLQDLVVESDSGARKPKGFTAILLIFGALTWSLFQLWVASPLPYSDFALGLNIPIFNSTDSRFFHLAFALMLAFLAYPATKKSPREYVPVIDWLFFIGAAVSVLYLYFLKDDLASRSGAPIKADLVVSVIGVILLLEAARRALGPPLVIIATIFLFYSFAGNWAIMPDVIAHKGQSLDKVASHQWLTTEGVFGIAISVSTGFVFLFVLFGALLEKAGAGNYFIKVAFSLLGHLKGGPAKAAVLSSGMTGLISGSSIANVVTTGTFTVPLMRKVGFSREKAGAVEVASSVNGQIMPPVMGAAAFLMVEYVGISYVEVVKHAFIPAIISYIALLYIVHLEALKANMESLPKETNRTVIQGVLVFVFTLLTIIIICGSVYYGIGWMKDAFEEKATYTIGAAVIVVYFALLFFASRFPPLQMDDPNAKIVKLPETASTVKTGLHYILPIFVLVWCLMVERLSPGLSAFWATVFMVFILVTQKPILSFFRQDGEFVGAIKSGFFDLFDGLVTGAKNMIGIGIATAAAGVIVGSVSLTGVGQVMTELVEIVSGGSFILVLIFTALICLVLGMGLPTTANYIVVSSLMAGVISELGAQNGLVIPLIAVHLFVFYFGIMADVTPPVGLASFAAAAVSGGDPIRTGIQAFWYSIRTVILPFIFIYNTELLLVGVDSWLVGFLVFLKATFAILIFAAATQGYFLIKSKIYETVILLLVAFTLFRPGFWVDMVNPPYKQEDVRKIESFAENLKEDEILKLHVVGTDLFGDPKDFIAFFKTNFEKTDNKKSKKQEKEENKGFKEFFENELKHLSTYFGISARENDNQKTKKSGDQMLKDYGLILKADKRGTMLVSDVVFNSQAEKDGFDFDFIIEYVSVPQKQFNKKIMYIFAFALFALVIISQRSRRSEIVS